MRYPVFLINLDRQPGRLDFMTAQLAALGITPIRIAAANGRDPAMLKAAANAPYAMLTPGEVGCFESHRMFWQRVVDDGLEGAFVLEDDVVVASDFARIAFDADTLSTVDAIKIDDSHPQDFHYGTCARPAGPGRDIVRMLGTEVSTGCYFVTQRGARRFLDQSRNYILPVDTFLFDRMSKPFWSFEVWKIRPSAATQINRLQDQETLTGDYSDRIQGAARPEQDQSLTGRLRMQILRTHRVLTRDTTRHRDDRARRNTAAFEAREAIDKTAISFHSPTADHYEPHLKRFIQT